MSKTQGNSATTNEVKVSGVTFNLDDYNDYPALKAALKANSSEFDKWESIKDDDSLTEEDQKLTDQVTAVVSTIFSTNKDFFEQRLRVSEELNYQAFKRAYINLDTNLSIKKKEYLLFEQQEIETIKNRLLREDNLRKEAKNLAVFSQTFSLHIQALSCISQSDKYPDALKELHEYWRNLSQPKAPVRKRQTAPIERMSGDMTVWTDRMQIGISRAFKNIAHWEQKKSTQFDIGFSWRHPGEIKADDEIPEGLKRYIVLTVGSSTGAHEIIKQAGSVRMLKLHRALMHKYNAMPDKSNGDPITLHAGTLCSWMGIEPKRDKEGRSKGYDRADKEMAIKCVQALSSVKIEGVCDGVKLMPGATWDAATIEDTRAPDKPTYEVKIVPGLALRDTAYLEKNPYYTTISTGWLTIDNKNEWAVFIGDYLICEHRLRAKERARNSTVPFTVSISKMLREIGIGASPDDISHPARTEERLRNALETLEKHISGVNISWSNETTSDISDEDLDNPEVIATYYGQEPDTANAWRKESIIIKFPEPTEALIDDIAQDRTKILSRINAAKNRRLGSNSH